MDDVYQRPVYLRCLLTCPQHTRRQLPRGIKSPVHHQRGCWLLQPEGRPSALAATCLHSIVRSLRGCRQFVSLLRCAHATYPRAHTTVNTVACSGRAAFETGATTRTSPRTARSRLSSRSCVRETRLRDEGAPTSKGKGVAHKHRLGRITGPY